MDYLYHKNRIEQKIQSQTKDTVSQNSRIKISQYKHFFKNYIKKLLANYYFTQ